jgi:hypothetical protein
MHRVSVAHGGGTSGWDTHPVRVVSHMPPPSREIPQQGAAFYGPTRGASADAAATVAA